MKFLTIIMIVTFLSPVIMAKDIRTEIRINASPARIWSILTDFENYYTWNPFITSIEGDVIAGKKIRVRLEPPDMKGLNMKPRVLVVDVNREFCWIGHLLIPGLFDGKHKFELIGNEDGTTTFVQSEQFKGILVPIFKKMLDINTTNGFIQMNQKLKDLAETAI